MDVQSLKLVTITPVIVPAAYGSGDQIGAGLLSCGAVALGKGFVKLIEATVIDNIKQSIAVDLLFFSDNVAVASSDNAAADVTDALMKASFLGSISFSTYIALNANSYSQLTPNKILKSDLETGLIYALPVSRGTPTYAGAGDLSFRLLFQQLSRG